MEWRPLSRTSLDFSSPTYDVVENIVGFIPVGIVLAELGLLRGILTAALISVFAEGSQFVMEHRDPSVIDVASNVIGAALGTLVSIRWRIRSPELRLNQWSAGVAAALAFMLLIGIWATSGYAVNDRGMTSPGTLEAHWKFNEGNGRVALDSSGHGLAGKFHGDPKRVSGVPGGAVQLDGKKDYIDFGQSSPLRLAGSMTISAWINSSSYPGDDAAIVSQLTSDFGYQLDTTIDKGPRTIGFKLINACGDLMARYGATPLAVGQWYHVAGVYDAEAKMMDVYLNGKLDNGFLLGRVTGTQHSSRAPVYVGRRPPGYPESFGFIGSIGDVRIYSLPLTNTEIVTEMHGGDVAGQAASHAIKTRPKDQRPSCAVMSDPEDAKLPGAAATLGVLVAIAFLGLWPSSGRLLCLVITLASGFLLLPSMAYTLPLVSRWTMPLVTLAGGASVVISVRRRQPGDGIEAHPP